MMKRGNFLFIEQNGNEYTISMTPELQDDIGTVGFVEYSEEDNIEKDGGIANLEASKTVLEITSPISGKVAERNEAVIANPTLLNSAKKEENWLVKLVEVDTVEFDALEEA